MFDCAHFRIINASILTPVPNELGLTLQQKMICMSGFYECKQYCDVAFYMLPLFNEHTWHFYDSIKCKTYDSNLSWELEGC